MLHRFSMDFLCRNLKSSLSLLFSFVLIGRFSIYVFFFYGELILELEVFRGSFLGARFPLIIDWGRVFFSRAVLLISGCVIIFSSFYIEHEIFSSRFCRLVILFVISINFLIFVPRFLGLIVGWDGLGLISFLLVIYYQNKSSLGAGMITVLTNRIGDVFFIIAIGLIRGVGRWLTIDIGEVVLSLWVMGFLVVGRITKRAQVPFSAWLPAAIAAPTPVSALVHSSTLVTAGVYVLIRIRESFRGFWSVFLLIMSIFTVVLAGMRAGFECDLKKVIALSTLSQLGIMMLAISLGAVNLCIFHLVSHAIFKALIFLCAGCIIHLSCGVQDSRYFRGIWFKLPLVSRWLVVSCFSLIGLPFMAGFYSKDLVIETFFYRDFSFVLRVLVCFGTFLTAFYATRFIILICSYEERLRWSKYRNDLLVLFFPITTLGVGAIFGGFSIQCFLLDLNRFIFLSRELKLVTPLIIFLGVGVRASLFIRKLNSFFSWVKGGFAKLVLRFSRKMWFLPFIRGEMLGNVFFSGAHKLRKVVDFGWVEEVVGTKGVSRLVDSLTQINSLRQAGLVGLYTGLGLVIFLIWELFTYLYVQVVCFLSCSFLEFHYRAYNLSFRSWGGYFYLKSCDCKNYCSKGQGVF